MSLSSSNFCCIHSHHGITCNKYLIKTILYINLYIKICYISDWGIFLYWFLVIYSAMDHLWVSVKWHTSWGGPRAFIFSFMFFFFLFILWLIFILFLRQVLMYPKLTLKSLYNLEKKKNFWIFGLHLCHAEVKNMYQEACFGVCL